MLFHTHERSWTLTIRVQTRRRNSTLTRACSPSPSAGRNPPVLAVQRAWCTRERRMPRWCVQVLWGLLIVMLVGWPTTVVN